MDLTQNCPMICLISHCACYTPGSTWYPSLSSPPWCAPARPERTSTICRGGFNNGAGEVYMDPILETNVSQHISHWYISVFLSCNPMRKHEMRKAGQSDEEVNWLQGLEEWRQRTNNNTTINWSFDPCDNGTWNAKIKSKSSSHLLD